MGQTDIEQSNGGERLSVTCRRCGGPFTITRTAAGRIEKEGVGPGLSAWIRDRLDSGLDVPEIDSDTLIGIEAAIPTYKVSEKQLRLLRALESRTKFPGEELDVTPAVDYPLAWAAGEREFRYLLRSLIERGLLRRTVSPADPDDSPVYTLEITAAGWAFLDEHARPSVLSDQAFVAMSFADDLKPAWENGIRPALVKAGFRPYRVDSEPHIERIDLKIITEIKNSRFLVADVTLQRPGVYFEAGYALGLGIPVFWCVRRDDLESVHFDTRQYNHIVWETEQHLADLLHVFVTAIVGKGGAT